MNKFYVEHPVGVFITQCLALFVTLVLSCPAHSDSGPDVALQQLTSDVNAAAVLLVNPDGKRVVDINADQLLIPASTAKLLLAWLVLDEFGSEYQIETTFFIEPMGSIAESSGSAARLWIKAAGDPYLTSEELPLLAHQLSTALRKEGIERISGFGVDESLFDVIDEVPGGSRTNNPYDALPSALAANFNTVVIQIENGSLIRGESQTPVTLSTQRRAVELGLLAPDSRAAVDARERVNLGFADRRRPAHYTSELLSYFLRQHAINVTSESLDFGSTKNLQELLRYRSTHALDDIARNMLTYSTNFIANQLSLVWTASINNKPANFEQFSERAMQRLRQSFGWRRFRLLEGAGLSRNNRLSARQLLDVVNALISYKELLPRYRDGVRAKTGTLNGVSSLAGFIDAAALPDASPAAKGNWHFAMLVNDETINDPSWREAVLDSLIERVRSDSMSH